MMQKADKSGRPWYGLVPTLVIGGGLAYLNVSYGKFAEALRKLSHGLK
jgi:amino acid permease